MNNTPQEKKANPLVIAIFAALSLFFIILGYVAIGRIENNVRAEKRKSLAKIENVFDLSLGFDSCQLGEIYISGGRNNIWLSGIMDYDKFLKKSVNGSYTLKNESFGDKKCYSVKYKDDKPFLAASERKCAAEYIVSSDKTELESYELYFYEQDDGSFAARLYGKINKNNNTK